MDARERAVVLVGLPGTGKGTQGKILGQLPGFYYFGAGEVLRKLDPSTDSGRDAHAAMARGELVPDELMMTIWNERLADATAKGYFQPGRHLLVLDGLPRTRYQAEALQSQVEVVQVVQLECDRDDELVHRIQQRSLNRERADDAREDVVRHRLMVYRHQTAPILEYYPKEIIARIDALQTPLEVLRNIADILIPHQPPAG